MKFTIWTCIRTMTLLIAAALTFALAAQAQTFSVLHSFGGGADGANPWAALVRDPVGNLYGTTFWGGAPDCYLSRGCGVVFKLDPAGNETVLHTFTGGADGANPYAGLIRDSSGNLYGTTTAGGAYGSGTVFKVTTRTTGSTETVLYSFTGGSDGGVPVYGSLIRDAAGTLYGTTEGGGDSGSGVVFKLDTAGNETVLYSFTGGADGFSPCAGLIRDAAGTLYGTTLEGGGPANAGVVFKFDATGSLTVLHTFTFGADGANPEAGLIRDTAGNLYGTTLEGGDTSCFRPSGCGVVFKLDTAGNETVLHTFRAGTDDGAGPFAGLIRDTAGNLYGTTQGGGAFGQGVVFKLAP